MKKIGLIFGGQSHEHDVSITSAFSFLQHIDYNVFCVQPIYIQKNGEWTIYQLVTSSVSSWEDLKEDKKSKLPPVDAFKELNIIFPLIHGETGEDGKLQGFLELLGLDYVGCNVEASAIGMNKMMAKEIAHTLGKVDIVPYRVVTKSEWRTKKDINNNLSFPLFVKPSRAGSSIGVSKVYDENELKIAIGKALLVDDIVIVEEFVKGREIEVGVIGSENIEVSLPGEITFTSDFYDYENKYLKDTSVMHIPAKLSPSVEEKMRESAAAVYRAIGCDGYARVDFFLEEGTDKVYFNEINTSPGFTEKSMFPVLFSKSGYTFMDLLTKIIDTHKNKNTLHLDINKRENRKIT